MISPDLNLGAEAGHGVPAGEVSAEVRHLYVHLPFCRSRCSYCDFRSEPVAPHERAGRVEAVVYAVRAELRARSALLTPSLETVYVGGGTPTVVPGRWLLPLLEELAARLAPGGELTVEANPGTMNAQLLRDMGSAGVTRLSLGVQSFSPTLLAALGRRVTPDEIVAALDAIAAVGWGEWNLDLVFGMPGQDRAAADADIRRALATRAPHLSVYDLSYPARYARRLPPAARAAAAAFTDAHYSDAMRALTERGHERYEVSAFALPGHRSRHNQAYWRNRDYVGLGPSAVSTVGSLRWTNPPTARAYLAGAAPEIEELTRQVRLYEGAMLGLRTAEGITESVYAPVLDGEQLLGLEAAGLVKRAYGILSLTSRGFDLSTAILSRLLEVPAPRASPPTAGMP